MIKILDAEAKTIGKDKQIGIHVEEYDKPIKEEITCGNEIDKSTFKLKTVRQTRKEINVENGGK